MFDVKGFAAEIAGQLLPPLPESTFLNTTTIKVNGQPISSTYVVAAIRVYRAVNKIPFAIISLHDGNTTQQSFPASDSNIFTPGNEIELAAGYHNDNSLIFKGIIIKHGIKIRQNAPPRLEIECKDAAVKMTVTRKNKYFYNQNDSDIIEDILRSNGIQGDGGKMAVQHREMVQYYVTDWDFMVLRAEANGHLIVADDGTVNAIKPDLDQAPKFNLNYGTSIFEYEAEMDARDQYPSAKAFSWNPSDQAVADSEMNENGAVGGGALGALSTAASTMANTAGQAAAALGADAPGTPPETDFKTKLGVAHLRIQHGGDLASDELQQWAGAQYTKSRLAKLRGRVRFQGVADIKPGDCITLSGVGLRHTGKVFVSAVLHEIVGGAWFTQVQFGMAQRWFAGEYDDVADVPAAAIIPPVHGLQVGIVTDLEGDPDSRQRIQVRLPMVDTVGDGIWMRLGSQDAGNNRGAVWRPEIGDEVIVGFINDDPRDGIVLGSLYSSSRVAPVPADDANPVKGWITRSDLRLTFDDDKKIIAISTPAGKKITLSEDAGKVVIEDENKNRIEMDGQGVVVDSASVLKLKAAQSIEIEAPMIAVSAQSGFTVEAQGQVQLKSTGDMTIQGSFVRIN